MRIENSSALIATMLVLLVSLATTTANAEERHHEGAFNPEHRHHLSVFLGDTRLLVDGESDEDAFTVGLDYEYRLSKLLGVGFVAEYAVDPLEATSFLGALDVHVYKGFVVQLGLGVEFIENTTNELGRVGMLYEFEFEEFTLSPQLHYDVTSAEDSVVFGIAIGKNF